MAKKCNYFTICCYILSKFLVEFAFSQKKIQTKIITVILILWL